MERDEVLATALCDSVRLTNPWLYKFANETLRLHDANAKLTADLSDTQAKLERLSAWESGYTKQAPKVMGDRIKELEAKLEAAEREVTRLISAWDVLEGGKHHSGETVSQWITHGLAPAFRQAKAFTQEGDK